MQYIVLKLQGFEDFKRHLEGLDTWHVHSWRVIGAGLYIVVLFRNPDPF